MWEGEYSDYDDTLEVTMDALRHPGKHQSFQINGLCLASKTVLHRAAIMKNAEMTRLALAYPGVDVNLYDVEGNTPLHHACRSNSLDVLLLLLADVRVETEKQNTDFHTPMWYAVSCFRIGALALLIASGREVDKEVEMVVNRANELAFIPHLSPLVELVLAFTKDPYNTRLRVRRELGWYLGPLAAKIFCLVVCVSDDFFTVHTRELGEPDSADGARRFMTIAKSLPMELQMVLCRRAVGLMRDLISASEVGIALRDLEIHGLLSDKTKTK